MRKVFIAASALALMLVFSSVAPAADEGKDADSAQDKDAKS